MVHNDAMPKVASGKDRNGGNGQDEAQVEGLRVVVAERGFEGGRWQARCRALVVDACLPRPTSRAPPPHP